VVAVFSRLGVTAFGGPAVHVAMMRDELVGRRRWVDEQDFVDALGATAVLPGPGSTQVAMYLGRRRAGWVGLFLSGICFIAPALGLVLAMAWAYVRYGHSPVGSGVLYGIRPVVVAIVVVALGRLAPTAVKGPVEAAVAVAGFALFLVGADVLVVLGGAALVMALWTNRRRILRLPPASAPPSLAVALAASGGRSPHRVPLDSVFWKFLELGSVVFGGGYVLLAFLRRDLVSGLHWIGIGPLLAGVAAGQLTPGPVFTTAAFIGYLVHGPAGALVATAAIFLPSFVMVAGLPPAIRRIRGSRWLGAALDGLNAVAIGLLAGVAVTLGRQAVVDPPTALIGVATLAVLVWSRVNAAVLIVAGAAIGVVHVYA
jgi:chromate transporter